MTMRFLGHPSLEDIENLREYLDGRYDELDLMIDAVQTEIDNLRSLVARFQRAEGILGSIYGKPDYAYALTNFVRAPVLNEDHSYFERHKFDSTQTATLIDSLLKPWQSHMRKDERLEYKIKKSLYMIEQKSLQLRALNELKNELRDDDNA